MARANKRPELSPFQFAARHAEADLMAVAELFVNAGEAVGKGDMGRMDALLEKMPTWHQMLAIRHVNRMDELRELDNVKPKGRRPVSTGQKT